MPTLTFCNHTIRRSFAIWIVSAFSFSMVIFNQVSAQSDSYPDSLVVGGQFPINCKCYSIYQKDESLLDSKAIRMIVFNDVERNDPINRTIEKYKDWNVTLISVTPTNKRKFHRIKNVLIDEHGTIIAKNITAQFLDESITA